MQRGEGGNVPMVLGGGASAQQFSLEGSGGNAAGPDSACSVSLRPHRVLESVTLTRAPVAGAPRHPRQPCAAFRDRDEGRAVLSVPSRASAGGWSGSHSSHLPRPWTPSFSHSAAGGGGRRCRGCGEEGRVGPRRCHLERQGAPVLTEVGGAPGRTGLWARGERPAGR